MENILVLGAGIFQVPLITKIKNLGYKAVVASIKGDYPGITIADIFVEADTTNFEKILSIAKTYNVAAVVTTGTDVSVPTMAYVSDKLNLKGPSLKAAQIVSSKTNFRNFLAENEFNCPEFKQCMSLQEASNFYNTQKGKIVLKPDDASGSRGVNILPPNLSESEFEIFFKEAMGFSRNSIVCAESFIEGIEVGGDAFLRNGEFVSFTTTHKHMEGVVVKGHTVPATISDDKLSMIKDEILKITHKLEYFHGPLNFDVIIGKSKATILEMGLRNGGNGIVNIIKHSQNVDLAQLLIDYVTDQKLILPKKLLNRPISSYVFGAPRGGVLKSITSIEELKKGVPEIIDVVLAKKPGDMVEPFTHNANLIGYVIFECDVENYLQITLKIKDYLHLAVEE